MDHPEIDLNAYALGEGTAAEREAAAAHLAATPEARDEFERLQFALTALACVRDEEIPRRIAFVSDPVFEPSLWQRFWASTPRLSFVGAGMLAVAITAHGFLMRPVPVQTAAPIAQVTKADIDAAVQQAVTSAVQAVEAKTDARVRQEVTLAVDRTEKRFTQEIQLMSATMQENETMLRKQLNRLYVTNAGLSIDGAKE
jgi:anti-sigma factor RsiW